MKVIKCRFCDETVNDKITVCPFCGNEIVIDEETEIIEELNSDDPLAKPWEKNDFFTDEENDNAHRKAINPAFRFYLDEEDEDVYFEREQHSSLEFRNENPVTNKQYITFGFFTKMWLWGLVAINVMMTFAPMVVVWVNGGAIPPCCYVYLMALIVLFFLIFNSSRIFFYCYLGLSVLAIVLRLVFGGEPAGALFTLADIVITFFVLYRYYRRDKEEIAKEWDEEALRRREKEYEKREQRKR